MTQHIAISEDMVRVILGALKCCDDEGVSPTRWNPNIDETFSNAAEKLLKQRLREGFPEMFDEEGELSR